VNLIRGVNHAIKADFDPFLQSLAQPVTAASTRANTTLVPKMMPLHDVDRATENNMIAGAHEQSPSTGPLQAPTLSVAKAGLVQTTNRSTVVVKKCFYWPICLSCATVCGGHHSGECTKVEKGEIVLPSNFKERKEQAQKEAKRKYARD
jgi:hypothetical protein